MVYMQKSAQGLGDKCSEIFFLFFQIIFLFYKKTARAANFNLKLSQKFNAPQNPITFSR